jgi:hypothetical protein
MTLCVVTLAFSAAWAQQQKHVLAPPKPAGTSPSLEVTMKFIQDKLNDVGQVEFNAYTHDTADDRDWMSVQGGAAVTEVLADPSACRVNYRSSDFAKGHGDRSFSLKAVAEIAVMPMEQWMKESLTAAGRSSWNSRVDRSVFVLEVRRTDKASDLTGFSANHDVFYFYDEQMANRVAKAMLHAVELCGGGSYPEPF